MKSRKSRTLSICSILKGQVLLTLMVFVYKCRSFGVVVSLGSWAATAATVPHDFQPTCRWSDIHVIWIVPGDDDQSGVSEGHKERHAQGVPLIRRGTNRIYHFARIEEDGARHGVKYRRGRTPVNDRKGRFRQGRTDLGGIVLQRDDKEGEQAVNDMAYLTQVWLSSVYCSSVVVLVWSLRHMESSRVVKRQLAVKYAGNMQAYEHFKRITGASPSLYPHDYLFYNDHVERRHSRNIQELA